MSSSSHHSQRTPLSNNTNSPVPPRSTSPKDAAADRPTAPAALRRRGSFRRLNPRADSSEDPPSAHSSIFEALYCSSSEGGGSGEKDAAKAPQPRAAPDSSHGEESSSRSREVPGAAATGASPGARDRLARLGRAPLETIMEKKSAATIRSASHARSHSVDGSMRASSQTSVIDDTSLASPVRRKLSLSLDDAASLNSSKKRPSSIAADRISPPQTVYRNYASPNMPTHNRPERVPTPPGVPSWSPSTPSTTPGQSSSALPTTRQTRYWDFFSRHPSGTPSSSGLTASQTPNQQRSVPVPNSRSRFRPPPSGYRSYGSLDMHPFHGAPIAKPWDPSSSRTSYLRPHSSGAMRMEYLRPVQEETTRSAGTPSTRPTTAPCPHAKRNINQATTPGQRHNILASHRATAQQATIGNQTENCWKCRLSRWKEQFSALCNCDRIGDYGTGTNYFESSIQPDSPRYTSVPTPRRIPSLSTI